jgi:tetratricopeptide (TPR) repeat protein
MKSIRHPNLVSLFGAWHKDNWLILAMELCDASLQDRLKEAFEQKLPGIPIKQYPEQAYAYFNRGYAWLEKKEYDKATLDFDKSVRLDPELWDEAWLYLEWLFFHCSEETRLGCEGGAPLRMWRLLHEDAEDDKDR